MLQNECCHGNAQIFKITQFEISIFMSGQEGVIGLYVCVTSKCFQVFCKTMVVAMEIISGNFNRDKISVSRKKKQNKPTPSIKLAVFKLSGPYSEPLV